MVELNPESARAPRKPPHARRDREAKRAPQAKLSKRRAPVETPAKELALAAAPSTLKPLLIGLGIGAALAAGAFVLSRPPKQRRSPLFSRPQPSVSGVLAKVVMVRLARLAARRAVRSLASQAVRNVAKGWNA